MSHKDTYNGMNSDQVFLSMTQFPTAWYEIPLIYIKSGNDSIRKIIGIEKHEIDTFSTVSKEIAIKMAKKVKEKFNSDYSIAVTGNAGPGTDGPGSFVGDCFIAVSSKSEIFCEKYNFVSSREDFIKIVTDNSFKLFVDKIINQ